MNTSQPPRGGSLPDPTVRTRVLEAFMSEVGARGLSNVSVDDVARTAGVSRVTLYRRWPTRRDLVVDGFALVSAVSPELPPESTARQAVDAIFARVATDRRRRELRQLLAELTAAAGYDPHALAALQERQALWRRLVTALVERGVETGEFPADREVGRTVEIVIGVATTAHLVDMRPPDEIAALVWALLTENRPY